jgi:hypothetical protein
VKITISEVHESPHHGHRDHEGEDIVKDSVDESIDQALPVEMLDALEFVVDVELGSHHDEAEDRDECY